MSSEFALYCLCNYIAFRKIQKLKKGVSWELAEMNIGQHLSTWLSLVQHGKIHFRARSLVSIKKKWDLWGESKNKIMARLRKTLNISTWIESTVKNSILCLMKLKKKKRIHFYELLELGHAVTVSMLQWAAGMFELFIWIRYALFFWARKLAVSFTTSNILCLINSFNKFKTKLKTSSLMTEYTINLKQDRRSWKMMEIL